MHSPGPTYPQFADATRDPVRRRRPPTRRGSRRADTRDIRCHACGALLAREQDGAIRIDRGGYEATFEVDDHLCCRLRCYQPWCRTLNVVDVSQRRIEAERA